MTLIDETLLNSSTLTPFLELSTSSLVILPLGPVPLIVAKSTFNDLAKLLTAGVAKMPSIFSILISFFIGISTSSYASSKTPITPKDFDFSSFLISAFSPLSPIVTKVSPTFIVSPSLK